MPNLSWIGKEAVVNHDKKVAFRLLKKVKSASFGKSSQNLIIHGDNLEGLKALVPHYYNKIKCIYIDPPYNTGGEKWIYNDNVNSPKIKKWLGRVVGTEGEDLTRHDKWLCMMYPRIKLLKELLSEDGIVLISIDNNEAHNLRSILGEIFGEENVDIVIWKKIDPKYDRNVNAKIVKTTKRIHEFIMIGYKKKSNTVFEKIKKIPSWLNKYTNPDNDLRGAYKQGIISFEEGHKNEDKDSENYYTIETPTRRKITRNFFISKSEFEALRKDNRIYFPRNGSGIPALKIFENEEKDFYFETILEGLGSLNSAKKELAVLFNANEKNIPFDTPKPLKLIKELIRATSDKDSIILDSFAGSGTTGQAVLDLNKEDGGNRKFILVELEDKVANDITAERVRRAINKYGYKDGFEYCELDKTLFNEQGQIEDTCTFNQLATYIYFTETQKNIDAKKIRGNFIGEQNETKYYLIYKHKGKNVLNKAFLKKLKKSDNSKVIYADKCLVDQDELEKANIQFKQIPYEVKVY